MNDDPHSHRPTMPVLEIPCLPRPKPSQPFRKKAPVLPQMAPRMAGFHSLAVPGSPDAVTGRNSLFPDKREGFLPHTDRLLSIPSRDQGHHTDRPAFFPIYICPGILSQYLKKLPDLLLAVSKTGLPDRQDLLHLRLYFSIATHFSTIITG